jgi:hypothetical protein
MSQKEFQRVKVIENAAGGRLSVRKASRLLQLTERPPRARLPGAAPLSNTGGLSGIRVLRYA